jgi:hypothetical protein
MRPYEWSWVGEYGPELAQAGSRGASVMSNRKSTVLANADDDGGNDSRTVVHYHMPIHIHATDVKGIQKSRRQIERQMAQSLVSASRAAA